MENPLVNILLIEDEDAHVELICRSFEQHSDRFSLSIVENLEKAKEHLMNSKPDLVISDMLLPDGKGMDLLDQNDTTLRFPMIVMTSYGDEKKAVQVIKLGALDYVVKSATTFSDMPRIAERALREWDQIVKRTHAEMEFKKSEIKYRTVIENANEAIIILQGNDFKYLNPKTCELTGYKEEELYSKSFLEIVHPDDQEMIIDKYFRRQNGEVLDEIYSFRVIGKQNDVLWAEIKPVIIDLEGEAATLCFINDITERKQVEDKLVSSEQRFRSAFQTSPDSINISQLDGKLINTNDGFSSLMGYSNEEAAGKTTDELNLWHKASARNDFISVMMENGAVHNMEATFKTKNGSLKTGLISANVIHIDEEPHILSVTRDITDRKQAEEKIKASLKEKETLLHEVHHRVKNNMQIISSLLKLQSNNIEDDRTKDILKDSQNRIFAMSAIHETLHGSENLSEIDLMKYLPKITTSIFQSSSVDPKKVTLNNNIEEIPISINQASPLGLIINELISNSLKYAFPDDGKGEINVSVKKRDNQLELTVMDDGVGISDDLDWKNSSTLGLKLVRTLVENQLDGSIDMESNNGTKFTIKFNIET
jgi:PAS domain S-box-containing protein